MKFKILLFLIVMMFCVENSVYAEDEGLGNVRVFHYETYENTLIEGTVSYGPDYMVSLKITDSLGNIMYKDITKSAENGKFSFLTDASYWEDGEYTFHLTDEMKDKYVFTETKPFKYASLYNKVLEYEKNLTDTRVKIKAVTKDEIYYVTYKLSEVYTDEEILIEKEDGKLFEIFSEENTVNVFFKNNIPEAEHSNEILLEETKGYNYSFIEKNDLESSQRYYIDLRRILNSDSEGFICIVNKNRTETNNKAPIFTNLSSGVIILVDLPPGGYIQAEVIINPSENILATGNKEKISDAKPIEITEAYIKDGKMNVRYEKNKEISSEVTVILKNGTQVEIVKGNDAGLIVSEKSNTSEIYIWDNLEGMKPLSMPYYINK